MFDGSMCRLRTALVRYGCCFVTAYPFGAMKVPRSLRHGRHRMSRTPMSWPAAATSWSSSRSSPMFLRSRHDELSSGGSHTCWSQGRSPQGTRIDRCLTELIQHQGRLVGQSSPRPLLRCSHETGRHLRVPLEQNLLATYCIPTTLGDSERAIYEIVQARMRPDQLGRHLAWSVLVGQRALWVKGSSTLD